MTYVTEQTPAQLRAHMKRLKAMSGWNEPLADRLYAEIVTMDAEIDKLRTQNQALVEALKDVISWFPGRLHWNTDAPINAVERARAALASDSGEEK